MDEIINRARRSDRSAVETLLSESYPAMHRIAHALCGDPKTAGRIVRLVLRRAVLVMPRWRKGITPENWFYHHMLLTARGASSQQVPIDRELLITAGPTGSPAYVAFVRALRQLPRQQMEAFILNHGEKLNSRLLGVSMDCSTRAATVHFDAATESLRTISGASFDELAGAFERAYATLNPPPTVVRTAVRREAAAAIWTIRLRRFVRRCVILIILALIAYAVWHWHSLLLQWFEAIRSKAQTQSAAAWPGFTTSSSCSSCLPAWRSPS
jgi:DNA-directed RNA polymerase specialized sigma24 family protein